MKTDDAPGVRFVAAKAAVTGLIDVLPQGHKIGLDVYGTSTGSRDVDKTKGCADVKTIVPFGKLDKSDFSRKLSDVEPSGYTPIGEALTKAAGELPRTGKRAIVLVSDGIDTCAPPDPCQVAKDLHAADDDLVIHTVGFKVEDEPGASEQLTCIAQVTGGLDLDASNGQLLRTRLAAAFNPALAARSIQPGGYRGLAPGMSLDEARQVVPQLGKIPSTGRIVIRYIDCDVIFTDGVLTEIRSAGKAVRTLDGVTIGDDISRAEKIYGTAGTPSVPVDNTMTYLADAALGTGYKMIYEPESAGEVSGTIITIVLCRCAPGGVASGVGFSAPSYEAWRSGSSRTVVSGADRFTIPTEDSVSEWLPGGQVLVARGSSARGEPVLEVVDAGTGKPTGAEIVGSSYAWRSGDRLVALDYKEMGDGFVEVLREWDLALKKTREVRLPESGNYFGLPQSGGNGVTFVQTYSDDDDSNFLTRIDAANNFSRIDLDVQYFSLSTDGSSLIGATPGDGESSAGTLVILDASTGREEQRIELTDRKFRGSCVERADKIGVRIAVRLYTVCNDPDGDWLPASDEFETYEGTGDSWTSVGKGDYFWQSTTIKLYSPHDYISLQGDQEVLRKLLQIVGGRTESLGSYHYVNIPGSIIRP